MFSKFKGRKPKVSPLFLFQRRVFVVYMFLFSLVWSVFFFFSAVCIYGVLVGWFALSEFVKSLKRNLGIATKKLKQ